MTKLASKECIVATQKEEDVNRKKNYYDTKKGEKQERRQSQGGNREKEMLGLDSPVRIAVKPHCMPKFAYNLHR